MGDPPAELIMIIPLRVLLNNICFAHSGGSTITGCCYHSGPLIYGIHRGSDWAALYSGQPGQDRTEHPHISSAPIQQHDAAEGNTRLWWATCCCTAGRLLPSSHDCGSSNRSHTTCCGGRCVSACVWKHTNEKESAPCSSCVASHKLLLNDFFNRGFAKI